MKFVLFLLKCLLFAAAENPKWYAWIGLAEIAVVIGVFFGIWLLLDKYVWLDKIVMMRHNKIIWLSVLLTAAFVIVFCGVSIIIELLPQ
jgi:hypothetical protein